MNEARHNLVLVTYTSVESFLKLLETNVPLVRLDRSLSGRQPLPAGFHITPYVMIQLRIDDELHLLKLIGETYNYWGDQCLRNQQAVEWSKDLAAACLETFMSQGVTVITNSHYPHPDLYRAAGIQTDQDIPPEFNRPASLVLTS